MQINVLVLGSCLIATFALGAGQPPENALPAAARASGAADGPYAPVKDNPGLPRVLLIGDSISEGYTAPVRRLLSGKANVHRIPENGGPTSNGLTNLARWLEGKKWDVIHFNWGLHDLKIMADGTRQVPPEAYEANLRRLLHELKATGAILVWATTTPVPKAEAELKVKRVSADVPVYNAIARKVMAEGQVGVDDLYSVALPQLSKIQHPADVHYTTEVYEVLAEHVAASIEAALPKGH